MAYETKQAILEEAGLSFAVFTEGAEQGLSGESDGTNKTFITAHKPLTDANYDDSVDREDVTAYVNGTVVPVASIDEATGVIKLQTAPANGAVVKVDYRYSPVLDAYVESLREEAEDWINGSLDGIDPTPYSEPVPPKIRQLTRQYAAAWLLIRDYGMNNNTDGTSKDGYKRLELVQAALDKYIAIGGSTGLSSVSAAEVDVYAEPEIFSTYSSTKGYINQDDVFMRDLGVED